MNDLFSSDALAVLLLAVAIFQYKRIGGFLNLLKIRLRASVWSPVPRAEVPAHMLHLLDCAEAALRHIGFQHIRTEAAVPFNAFDPRALMYADLYWHPDKAVLARVELAEALTGQVTKVQFLTVFADGKVLATVNREQWAQLPVPEDILVEDAYADDLAGQWQAHQDAMAREAEHRAIVTGQDEVFQREAALGLPHWMEHMRRLGWVCEEAPDCYRFTARGAWGYSGQLVRLSAQARKALACPYRHDPAPDLQTARLAEMDAMAAILALASKPLPTWVKTGLFVLTLALSAMLFGRGFGLMEAAVLLTVLLVHELGHLAAMWAFDYRNLSIFFLPFLGAAAVGHKPHAPPWQEAIVLLAGPVPGLLLAFAATQIPSESLPLPVVEFIRAWVWFSVFLNLFNLLPVGVLDGGRLFELAVLGRFPHARAVFAVLGVAAGLLYAVWTQSIAFGVVMLLLMLGIPLQFKAAGVIAAIRAKAKLAGTKRLDGEQAVHALGLEFASGGYGDNSIKGWTRRMNIARLAYPKLLQGIPGLGASLVVLAALGVSLFAPLILLTWTWTQPGQQPLMRITQAEQQAIARRLEERPERVKAKRAKDAFLARYAAQDSAAAKWVMLDRHEDDNLDFGQAHRDWIGQQRAALIGQLPANHPGKLQYQLEQAQSGTAGAADSLLAVAAELSGNAANLDEKRFVLLLQAYRRLAEEAPERLEAQKATLETLWTVSASPGHLLAGQRAALAHIQAHRAFAAGQIDEAETWMERYQTHFASKANNDTATDFAALTQAWFLLDIGRPDQVLALASHAIETAKPDDPFRLNKWRTLAGWAEMGRGRPREADAYFQAVLGSRIARLNETRDQMPWWQRLLFWRSDAMLLQKIQRRIDAQMLDHLAALERYNPAEAARLLAELAKGAEQARQRPPYIDSTTDGWGKAREEAHGKLLTALNLPAQEPAIHLNP